VAEIPSVRRHIGLGDASCHQHVSGGHMPGTRFDGRLGSALVAMQFMLIAALSWLAWPTVAAGDVPAGAWALAAASAGLGLWAITSNRPGNFNIHPAPREGGQLVQRGPYRWIRHPMYTAVMGCGLACAWASSSDGWKLAIASGLCVLALTAVLVAKATLEERWMLTVHPGYATYRARTRRFLPGVF
jgi:protein-S-isoprenylcysteine O-methyltransferase Ste14